MATIGQRLRALRLDAGLSQSDLAGDGLSASYISLLETGKRTPSDEVVNQLAARLKCSPSQLRDGELSEREERVNLEIAFARLALDHGEAPEARRRLERVLDDGDSLPDRIRDDISFQLGVACDRVGDYQAGARVFLPLFERARTGKTHLLVTLLGLGLCRFYMESGDLNKAVDIGEVALAAARNQGLETTVEYYRLAATVMYAYTERGDHLHARLWAEGLLEQARDEDVPAGQAVIYWNLAQLAESQGRLRDAIKLSEQALSRLSELDNTRDYARLRLLIAMILLNDSPPRAGDAIGLLQRCESDIHDLGGAGDRAQWNWLMAQALLHTQDDPTTAENYARKAVELAGDDAPVRADALRVLSDVLVAQGSDLEAEDVRRAAFAAMADVQPSHAAAQNWRETGERLAGDDIEMALAAFRHALEAAGVRDRSPQHRARADALRARRTSVGTADRN